MQQGVHVAVGKTESVHVAVCRTESSPTAERHVTLVSHLTHQYENIHGVTMDSQNTLTVGQL